MATYVLKSLLEKAEPTLRGPWESKDVKALGEAGNVPLKSVFGGFEWGGGGEASWRGLIVVAMGGSEEACWGC